MPASTIHPPITAWQRRLRDGVTRLDELLALVGLEAEQVGVSLQAAADFPLRVPRGFVARMRFGDPEDPLLRQVLPVSDEDQARPGFIADPLAEALVSPTPGVLHKFHGRALLITTGACGVHCRYCFRRHFPYAEHAAWGAQQVQALDYLRADPSIREVILSGGDPLAVSDDKLAELAASLAEISHLDRLRVHSRMPIVLPERVDDALLAWLAGSRLRPVMVVHANHANEIDGDVAAAFGRLRDVGVTLLNQAVLLRGVNDSADALVALSEALFAAGALPYYLFLLDPVAGAAHFDVDEATAKRLMNDVTGRLPGYLVPKLAREVPGAPAKVTIP